MVVSQLGAWQARLSSMPGELLTEGKLLLLSCRETQAELGECCSSALLPDFFPLSFSPSWLMSYL